MLTCAVSFNETKQSSNPSNDKTTWTSSESGERKVAVVSRPKGLQAGGWGPQGSSNHTQCGLRAITSPNPHAAVTDRTPGDLQPLRVSGASGHSGPGVLAVEGSGHNQPPSGALQAHEPEATSLPWTRSHPKGSLDDITCNGCVPS